jgi:hypothetical protein
MFHRSFFPIFLLSMAFLLPGTTSYAAEQTAEIESIPKEKEGPHSMTQAELQSLVMNFSDQFAVSLLVATKDLKNRVGSPQDRRDVQETGLFFTTAAWMTAANANPEVSLLDMVVMVTLGRIVVEEYWIPQVWGDQGKRILEVFRKNEAEIWAIAAKVLTQEQQQELHALIREWRASHPEEVIVAHMRFSDFAALRQKSLLADAARSGGLLGIKGAAQAVDEIRLVSERAMFYLQRMPPMLNLQAELLFYKLSASPEIEQLRSDSSTLSNAFGRFAKMTDQLPVLIEKERTAAIDQLTRQVGERVTAERKAAIDQLMDRVQTEGKTGIDQLMEWLAGPGKDMMPSISVVVDGIGGGGDLVDQVFRRATMLILIFLAGSFLTMLAYRYASERLFRSS